MTEPGSKPTRAAGSSLRAPPSVALAGAEGQRPPVLGAEPVDPSPWLTRLSVLVVAGAALLDVVGVPSVDLHGPLHYVGIMDPLCGGTRSVYLFVHGHLLEAATYNPAGPVLLAVSVAVLVRAVTGRLFGHWLTVHVPSRVVVVAVTAALVALEVNQQSHVVLLTSSWIR